MAKKQNGESGPLVAVDLGSSSIRVMAAERDATGLLRVLGVEQSVRNQSVERGLVVNTSNAGFGIKEALSFLGNRIGYPTIQNVFACIGGRSMMLTTAMSKRNQVKKREISPQLLQEMENECKNKIEAKNPNVVVLYTEPFRYILDEQAQNECPTAQQKAIIVEVHYTVLYGKKELEQKVQDSFLRAGKLLEKTFVRPDALLTAIACNDDLDKGCAILDMGAQTTTLTVYKGNQYLFNKVVACGGHDITTQIALQGMPIDRAERLKCEQGWASPEMVEHNYRFRIKTDALPGGELVMMSDELAQLIEEKLEVMVVPLLAEIEEMSGDISVLYITGGASMLRGMEQYVANHTSIPVMYASHAEKLTDDTPDEMCQPCWSSLIGTLLLGLDWRATHKQINQLPKHKVWLKLVEQKTLVLFGDEDN